jgi:hypothetical protein
MIPFKAFVEQSVIEKNEGVPLKSRGKVNGTV